MRCKTILLNISKKSVWFCREEAWTVARLPNDTAGHCARARQPLDECWAVSLWTRSVPRARWSAGTWLWHCCWHDYCRWLHGGCIRWRLKKSQLCCFCLSLLEKPPFIMLLCFACLPCVVSCGHFPACSLLRFTHAANNFLPRILFLFIIPIFEITLTVWKKFNVRSCNV